MVRRCVASIVLALTALGLGYAQGPSRLVFTNANVLDVAAGRLRPVAAVIVEGRKIVAVNDAMPPSLPEGVIPVDLGKATLVPALADLAVQTVPGMDLDADFFYAMSLAHGVMRIRAVDARLPWAVQQKARVAKGEVVAPRLWTSGPAVDMRSPMGNNTLPSIAAGLLPFSQVRDAAAMGPEVQRQAAASVDWIRLRENVPFEAARAAVAAVKGLKTRPRISLAPVATSLSQAAQAGVALIDGLGSPLKPLADLEAAAKGRGDAGAPAPTPALLDVAWSRLSGQERRALISQLARTRVALAPMLVDLDARRGRLAEVDRDLAYLPERIRSDMQARLAAAVAAPAAPATEARAQQLTFVRDLVKAGGRVVTASSATAEGWPVPGVALHREIALLVEAGLTPADALRAATATAGEVLGETGAGTWRPGSPADFFAVKGDPLTDVKALADITLIVRGGEVLDRNALLRQARRATGRVK